MAINRYFNPKRKERKTPKQPQLVIIPPVVPEYFGGVNSLT